jgi:REP element-mobilizing transposase RayT
MKNKFSNMKKIIFPPLLVFVWLHCAMAHQQHIWGENCKLMSQMAEYTEYYPDYFTATILEWKKLLKPEKYKQIVADSLHFLVADKRIKIYAFVIMDNHLHLIWQMMPGHKRAKVQQGFLKFTAQQLKEDLMKQHPQVLQLFKVNAADREYQFWERNPLSIELRTPEVFIQKLEYIHWNPVKAGLCVLPEEYKYSSAKYYETGIRDWGFVTHYMD